MLGPDKLRLTDNSATIRWRLLNKMGMAIFLEKANHQRSTPQRRRLHAASNLRDATLARLTPPQK